MANTIDQQSAELAHRLILAIRTVSGRPWISPANLGRRLHRPTSEIKAILAGAGCSDLRLLVRLARLLMVDPRWLALGVGPALDGGALERTLKTGVCRYCGCTDDRACPGGCGWLDEMHTICSACLTAGAVGPACRAGHEGESPARQAGPT
jgi:hypothetical protein